MSKTGPTKLEIEDDEEREKRIGNLLERLNNSSSSTHSHPAPPLSFDFGERKTFPVDPPSELLARVREFLPRLEAENAIISQRAQADPNSVDIENVDGDDQYIEMNLGLGVFEDRSKRASNSQADDESTEEDDTDSMHMSAASSSSSSSSPSDDESSASSSEDSQPPASLRPILPLPRRSQKPQMEILTDN